MLQHINHYDRKNFAGEKGFDDSAQRESFKKMMSSCALIIRCKWFRGLCNTPIPSMHSFSISFHQKRFF